MHKSLRLHQGPFEIEQDDGWRTIAATTPASRHVRNFGTGMIGYTWEENGPSTAARNGSQSLEEHVAKLASLPFVDVLYIRCDWMDVQSWPGRLDLHPVWGLTLEAAKWYGLRVAFRIQMSSPEIQPDKLSIPDFLRERVPLVKIGSGSRAASDGSSFDFYEPRYDHPEFIKAFKELNALLANEFDGNPLIEFADLMMYGFWGEGHTSGRPHPFPDYYTARQTFLEMTRIQLEIWKKTPVAVNTQPDISCTGNRDVQEAAISSGCWLRSDSILVEEPVQIEMLSGRPPWLPVIMEDGYKRHYRIDEEYLEKDETGLTLIDKAMLHVLDLKANYWSLWTEADNLSLYFKQYPAALNELTRRMGYRLRPSWVWQRKRLGTDELIVAVANDGVAGVPGVLRLIVIDADQNVIAEGVLDEGQPFGGGLRQASLLLPPGMQGQNVGIKAALITHRGIEYGINWACQQPVGPEGAYWVHLHSHDDTGWRKGI